MQYSKLVEVYESLDKTTKRLEKTHIVSELLKKTSSEELPIIMLLLEGRLFPSYDSREIGMASKLLIKAISTASGTDTSKVETEWKKTGDLGNVAEKLLGVKKQVTLHNEILTIKKVFLNLRKLAELQGQGTVDKKVQLVVELLSSAKPAEAKYIVRTILQVLRVGIGEGSVRDAIVWAFFQDKINLSFDEKQNSIGEIDREAYNKYMRLVQRAFDVTNDYGIVAETAKNLGEKGLENMNIQPGIPVKVMLAQKVDNAREGFEKVQKPAELEFKYDGFRILAHKKDNEVKLFTRRLENVSLQFPEAVKCIKENVKGKEFILDCEAVGFDKKTGRYLPFQNISQRIKRKYDIEEISENLPVELNVFDIIYYNGKSYLNEPFEKRRKLIESIIKEEKKRIVLARKILTSSEKDVEAFYKESIKLGNEGVMFKSLNAPYQPGSRVGFMVKFKKERETFDLVVVSAEWGEGKRAKWLSSFCVACKNNDKLMEIGKVSTGLKEKSDESLTFEKLTKILKPLILSEKGKEVKINPSVIIEVGYEEIQKSPSYGSGFALRFPRVIGLREDKGPEDATTLDIVKEFYNKQKKSN